MPEQNNPRLLVDEAQSREADVFELFFDTWGYAGQVPTITDFTNLQWPAPPPVLSVPVSLAGIAIGPRSTVDRAWISYNIGRSTVDATDVGPPLTNRLRQVSIDSPLMFTIQAASGSMNDPATETPPVSMARRGSLYVYPFANTPIPQVSDVQNETTVLPLLHTLTLGGTGQYSDVNGVARTFATINSVFMAPYLHLYLFLKTPTRFQPGPRAPFFAQQVVAVSSASEGIVAQIPVYGRKSVHVLMEQVSGTGTCDFRVGALRSIACEQEWPVDQILAVPKGTPVVITPCAGQHFEADYVNLYAKPSVAAPFIRFSVTAYD